jgi:hypothetical protein
MAENDLSTVALKKVSSIEKHLNNLQSAAQHLLSLYHYCQEAQHEDHTLSLDDLNYFHGVMDMAVDTISSELGLLKYADSPSAEAYVRKPQPPAQGGEA